MRIRTIFLILVCLLVPLCASAELGLEMSMERVPVGSILDFSLTGSPADTYRYTLSRGGKELFSTETTIPFGSYLPREMGEYTLKVSAESNGVEVSTTADFQVVQALTLAAEALPDTVQAGGAVQLGLKATGGTEPYRYVYAVTCGGETLLEESGGDRWYWLPPQEGSYTLHMAVIDSQGASRQLQSPLTVTAGQGMELSHTGGALRKHGGQESWMVCASGSWTAETDADFLTIETPEGQPGDALVITAGEEADSYREGTVRILSGDERLEWVVAQSGQQGVDEDVFLFSEPTPLYIDGSPHAVWLSAEGSRTFQVSPAEGECQLGIEGDFLTARLDGSTLTVTAAASDTAAVRSGLVTVALPGGCAYVHVYQLPGKSKGGADAVSGLNWHERPMYSQSSGAWKEAKYGSSTLEHSGCAIFALSHGLELLGYEGESITPQALAKKYAFCLRDGGTINSTLIGNAGEDFGFKTRFDLYKELPTIRDRLERGAVFSFAVVMGHIALVAEQSEDGSMMRIIDSAPSATWERIKNAQLYKQEPDGSFTPITGPEQLEGIRYYPENDAFGAATYWLESSYVAKRGVRLLLPENE